MSDTLLDTLIRSARIVGPGYASSFATNFMPDRQLEGIAGYIPGVSLGERILGMGGGLYDAASDLGQAATGYSIGHAPEFMATAGQHALQTEQGLYNTMGGVEPQNAAERILHGIASGAGALGPMAPAGVMGAVRGAAPALLRPVLGLVPTTANAVHAAQIGGKFGGGLTAADEAIQYAREHELFGPDSAAQAAQQPQSLQDVLTRTFAQPQQQQAQPTAQPPTAQPRDLQELLRQTFPQTSQPLAQDNAVVATPDTGQSPYTLIDNFIKLAAGLAGVAGARRAAQIGARATAAERSARMLNPEYAQEAADYNDSVIKRTGAEISDPNAPPPPDPPQNIIRDWGVKAQTWGLDAVAQLRNYIQLTSDNPAYSKRLSAQMGMAFDEQAWDAKFMQFLVTGRDPISGRSIPRPADFVHDVVNLDPARRKIWADAVEARDEKDNRNIMLRSGPQAYGVTTVDELRHNFYHQSTQELDAIIARATSDPVVNNLLVRGDMIGLGTVDILQARNRLPIADAAAIKNDHQHFIPETDREGRIRQIVGPRVLAPGGGIEQRITDPLHAMMQHLEAAMREADVNDAQTAFIDHQVGVQKAFPDSAQFVYQSVLPSPMVLQQPTLYPSLGTAALGAREPTITIYRSTGAEHWRVDHPEIFDTLVGANVARQRAMQDSMGVTRRLLQQMTTGVSSLATGRFVPVRNAWFTAAQAPINATGDLSGGLVARATGLPKAITAPFDVIGNTIAFTPEYLSGLKDRLVLAASRAFRPDNMDAPIQVIRSIVGDQALRNFSDNLMDIYTRSLQYEMGTRGIGGQSLQKAMEIPLLSRDSQDRAIRLGVAQLEPRVLMNADGSMSARPFVMDLKRWISTEFINASESTHRWLYRLNRDSGMDPNVLASEIRGIVGDPSISGGSKTAQTVRQHVPYANVAVQGTRRFGRALAEEPINTSAAALASYGMLGFAVLATAFRSQANINHLVNEMSTEQRVANIPIYNGTDGANSVIMLPVPQEMRLLWAYTQAVLMHLHGVQQAAADPKTATDILSRIKDLGQEHLDKSEVAMMEHGLNDSLNFVDFPVWMKAPLAAAGASGRVDFARAWNDYKTGDFGLRSFFQAPSDFHPLPGMSPNDSAMRNGEGKRWSELFANAFGAGGALFDQATSLFRYHAQGYEWATAAGYVGQDWLQGLKDYNAEGNTLLFENQVRASRQPPIAEQGQQAIAQMRKTEGAYGGSESRFGFTPGQQPLAVPTYPGQQGKIPTDPQLRSMYLLTSGKLRFLDQTLLPQINAIRAQMDAVGQQMLNPAERRQWMNERTRDLADKWRQVMAYVDDLNAELSSVAGVPVNVQQGINWQGDMSQFR